MPEAPAHQMQRPCQGAGWESASCALWGCPPQPGSPEDSLSRVGVTGHLVGVSWCSAVCRKPAFSPPFDAQPPLWGTSLEAASSFSAQGKGSTLPSDLTCLYLKISPVPYVWGTSGTAAQMPSGQCWLLPACGCSRPRCWSQALCAPDRWSHTYRCPARPWALVSDGSY